MGLLSNFGKMPSGSSYGSTRDGQEGANNGIISSIYRNIEDENELVHRFPYNNISTKSVLTVQTGQMACFYMSGQLADVFLEGRHELTTANIPVLQRILNLPSGGDTTFQATIYFVNLMEKRNVLWGAGGMRIIDPYFEIPIKINMRGQFGFSITDGALFVTKLVSTLHDVSTEKIHEQFRSDIVTESKVLISKYMKSHQMNINDLSSEYREIASFIKESLILTFDTYGIRLGNFNIEGIDFDETDPGYIKVMDAIAERKSYEKQGDLYDKKRQYDIMETAAGNEGGAGMAMGAGMGLGMGMGMGQIMGNMMGGMNAMGSAPTPPPVPGGATSFYMANNGQTTGPFTLDQLRGGIAQGQVTPQTYLCAVGSTQWVFAEQIPVVAGLFQMGSMPPPPPPPAPAL